MKTDTSVKLARKLKGTIVSNKMDKTVVVSVDLVKTHPKYGKKYTVSTKYHVHDPQNAGAIGDIVEFVACRPLSKKKRWRLA